MHREMKRMCGKAHWSLRYYMVLGEEDMKNKAKKIAMQTKGVKAKGNWCEVV